MSETPPNYDPFRESYDTAFPPPLEPEDDGLEKGLAVIPGKKGQKGQKAAPVRPRRRGGRSWIPRLNLGLRLPSAGLAIALLLALVGGGLADHVLLAPASTPATSAVVSDPADFAIFEAAWNLVQTKYVGIADVDKAELLASTLSGLVDGLGDTGHSRYLTAAEQATEQAVLNGQIVGIGVRVDLINGAFVARQVFAGGPADGAGMRAGDQIVSVDGKTAKGLTIDALTAMVRGPVGSKVVIGLTRATKPLNLTIVRASVSVPAVDWAMVPGTKVADLLFSTFSKGSGDELIAAITAAQAAGASGLILDLRGNPGGYVNEAVKVASQFLGEGNVYQTKNAAGQVAIAPVLTGGLAPTIPLVVLIDASSASASEIVAGALQDAGRAKLIGATTSGTGTVLETFPLSDGSALFLGTAEWLTRNGRQIWHQGIVPDQAVAMAKNTLPIPPASFATAKLSADAQLSAALKLLAQKP